MESIKTVAKFTEILKSSPRQAYDFISMNYYKMDKSDLATVVKELLFSIYNCCDTAQVRELLRDVAIELDEQYDEAIRMGKEIYYGKSN